MMSYKDMTFCTAKDCAKMECLRNTRNKKFFCPSDFWKDKIAWSDFQNQGCPDYAKIGGATAKSPGKTVYCRKFRRNVEKRKSRKTLNIWG